MNENIPFNKSLKNKLPKKQIFVVNAATNHGALKQHSHSNNIKLNLS